MKLLYIPIAILLIISIFSMLGLGVTSDLSEQYYSYYKGTDNQGNKLYLYSYDGTAICGYDGSPKWTTDNGVIVIYNADGYPPMEVAWRNATSTWQLFYDSNHEEPVFQGDLTPTGSYSRPTARAGEETWTLAGSLGFIGLVAVIMGIGAIAGVKILGSGESEISVSLLLQGTFFISIWAVLSGFAYPLLLSLGSDSIGILFYAFYFVLTVIYSIGVINQVSTSGD